VSAGHSGAWRPNLEDVAARAGVSRSTVSRVVNGRENVASDLRERVEMAISELGYVPNQSARALMTQRTDSVALVVPEPDFRVFADPFFSGIVRGASMECTRAGLQLVLLMAPTHDDLERVARFLGSGPVDAILLVSEHSEADPTPKLLAATKLPFVIGGRPMQPGLDVPYVDNDNERGAEIAVRHLLSLGRSVVGTVSGPPDMSAGIDRLTGFRRALGPAFDERLIEHGDFTERGGEAAARRLLERVPNLDGLFAASDLMAVGAMRALHEAGRRIPDDVAVVGFDDNEYAETADPPLTTVRQDPVIQGREMVRLYLTRHRPDITIPEEPGVPDIRSTDRIVLPVELVVRASAPQRARAPHG
jgi:DNA-binding LacI/PurR family transcriptional regulator